MTSRSWLLAATSAFGACSATSGDTAIVVNVYSDFDVPTEMNKILVDVVANETRHFPFALATSSGGGKYDLPLQFALAPQGAKDSPFSISATGFLDATTLVSQDATLAFLRGEKRTLDLFLSKACVGKTCPAGFTCSSRGECDQAKMRNPSDLPPYSGKPDGGSGPDAPLVDAAADPMLDAACAAGTLHCCNEVTSDPCGATEKCVLKCADKQFRCEATSGSKKLGESCSTPGDCGRGLSCGAPPGMTQGVCFHYCQTSADCPSGKMCRVANTVKCPGDDMTVYSHHCDF